MPLQVEDNCAINLVLQVGNTNSKLLNIVGRPCVLEKHLISIPHTSKYESIHSCYCGRTVARKQDPFDISVGILIFIIHY